MKGQGKHISWQIQPCQLIDLEFGMKMVRARFIMEKETMLWGIASLEVE